jgi:hypothetical protein
VEVFTFPPAQVCFYSLTSEASAAEATTGKRLEHTARLDPKVVTVWPLAAKCTHRGRENNRC